MERRKYVVRVVIEEHNKEWFNNPVMECLRHAGLVKIHNPTCFDVLPPSGVVPSVWAEQEAARMQSFLINAVAAPEWGEE